MDHFIHHKKQLYRKGICKIENIQVIDAPCGSGKTEYIIRYMNDHSEQRFLYISPLREMFDRIEGKGQYEGRGVVAPFRTPDNKNHKHTKLESIKQLLRAGANIMSTHALFMMFDDEAIEILKSRDYHLIIDEAINAATVIKTAKTTEKNEENDEDDIFHDLDQRVRADDINFLVQHGAAKIDADNYGAIEWIDDYEGGEDHRYADLEKMIKSGAMSQVKDTFLIWHFPTKVLAVFKNITVLTYRFRHSIMRCYLDFNEMNYDHKTVVWVDNAPQLTDFTEEVETGSQWAKYVNIFEGQKLNAIGVREKGKSYPLSYTWYGKPVNSTDLKTLKNNCTNYFRHKMKAPTNAVMWTTYKAAKDRIAPSGYTAIDIVAEDGTIAKEKTFVACTCKATEHYKDKYILAYLIDRHLNPGLERFFEQKGITIDKNEWALSELIQWLFRSRIRDSRAEDRNVYIYIPSARMRKLLKKWLDTGEKRSASRPADRAA